MGSAVEVLVGQRVSVEDAVQSAPDAVVDATGPGLIRKATEEGARAACAI
jgi:hypothetical protein